MQINTLLMALAMPIFAATASARLAAWYPLDEAANAPEAVSEAVSGTDTETFLLGFDPDPAFSLITRGHPSARPGLGTSYLLEKGGGLDLGGAEAVQPTDKFTIAFFFQPITFDAFDRFLESQVTNTNAQDGIRIDTGGGAGNHVRVLVRDNNGATNTQFQHPLVLRNDGTWYFFAFRYDSDGIDNDPFQLTLLEVSGDPVDEFSIFDATAGNAAVINTGPIGFPHAAFGTLLGAEVPDNPNQPNHINAALDEFAFYDNSDGNGVLSDADLANVYNFGPSATKIIDAFTSDAASVTPGSPANLSWTVIEPFDTLTLDDGNGNITDLAPLTTAGTGTTAVTPATTTTYTLRATRAGAANSASVRILAGAAPDINSFTTSATYIRTGGSIDLSWAVTGADSLTLDPGATDVSALTTTNLSPAETTTYTLSATNPFGTSTSELTVNVLPGPVPTHRYIAANPNNVDNTWIDEIGGRNWTLTGAIIDDPLLDPSPNTNITASFSAGNGDNGGSAATFAYPEFTGEFWIRPFDLNPDHEVIFESGGGQNGIAALINDAGFRFIGSRANAQTFDLTIPVTGLNLDDFLQLTIANSIANGSFDVTVRDTFGNVRTLSEPATGQIGNNGAGLFIHAAGALGGDNNLGGRTELPDMTPEGLTGFNGEIAIVNIYDYLLDPADSQLTFDSVATTTGPPVEAFFGISQVSLDSLTNELTLTWNSSAGKSYDTQFSTDLQNWFDLAGPFVATGDETTQTVALPNQPQFHVRVRELAP